MRTSRSVLASYVAIVLFGIAAALPNLLTPAQLDALPGWLPHQQVTLGLDLRGGSHLVLEVDADTLVGNKLETMADDARQVLREEGIGVTDVKRQGQSIVVTLARPDVTALASAERALRQVVSPAQPTAFGEAGKDIDVRPEEDRFIRLTLTEAGVRARVNAAIEQSLEIVRQRVDQIGVAEPTLQRVGADRILVQLPGLQDPTRLRTILGSTAQMSFHMLSREAPADGRAPIGTRMLPSAQGPERYPVERRTALSGERLTDARAGFDSQTGEPVVTFRFDSLGARQFGDITRNNIGRPFAIVLDGKVLSAPVIREPITGGTGQISGNFTVEDTVTLSALLRSGALPAPLTVIEERSVGPGLGSDAINMGIWAGLAGFGLVIAFMLTLYGRWGLVANLALGLNVILTFGALSLLGATLTLPGIAGIILSIGIAVDANILINERIREETKKGLKALAALETGFSRAYSTIIDANVTTLIATALLFSFGSGPVRGFAITMMIGIGISMFTAVAVVRLVMAWIVRRQRIKVLRIEPPVRFMPEGTKIGFMKARYLGIAVSIFLSLASVGLFINPGLSYGIDFKGGIQMEVKTGAPADLAQMRAMLGGLGLGEIAMQEFGDDRSVLIRVERQPGGDAAQSKAVTEMRKTVASVDGGASVERAEVVGPKVSGELAQAALLSVALASLAMLVYIWWRFEWPFAAGAIVTLILDVTKTVGFFALTGLDFNLTAIAALLTIVGYSVNDKVVVYDRMRENMRLYKKMPLRDLIDMSINQTFGRCLFTSMTTFLALLPMAIWGGSAVASFALPMIFGVVIATSSSIFIAAPILLFLGDWRERRRKTGLEAGKAAMRATVR
ncbi:protein translocase subunit SecD [Parvibaculum sp.]|uniref:protein translocase subunit SecD n=1 Tax=Parvibaculum sp. TaxID=2024848 RepID=UPI001E09073E|nr:protein translocase subunit SecD [Parvibaculum sp.]MBX3488126.1 protein translocase subunit SecD [Parvibaculum sp.]MCW5727896.1 protein translocase subunit SecD [Parvibaculum sp.]